MIFKEQAMYTFKGPLKCGFYYAYYIFMIVPCITYYEEHPPNFSVRTIIMHVFNENHEIM